MQYSNRKNLKKGGDMEDVENMDYEYAAPNMNTAAPMNAAPVNQYNNIAMNDEMAEEPEEFVPTNMNGAGRKRKASRKVARKASRKVARKASTRKGRKASRKVARKASTRKGRKASRKSRKASRK